MGSFRRKTILSQLSQKIKTRSVNRTLNSEYKLSYEISPWAYSRVKTVLCSYYLALIRKTMKIFKKKIYIFNKYLLKFRKII